MGLALLSGTSPGEDHAMHIILRKIGGRLEALWQRDGSTAGAAARSYAVSGHPFVNFLLSPLVLAVLLFALLVMWTGAHPGHAPLSMAVAGMAVNVRELRAKRATLATQLREMTDTAEKEKRNLSTEEDTKYATIFKEIDELRAQVEREERQAEVERQIAAEKPAPAPADPTKPEARVNPRGTPEYRDAFATWITRGHRSMSEVEQRALSVGSDTGGGFTVASEQFVDLLLKAIDNVLWIRQLATKFAVPTAVSLGVMTLDADPADADWTSELATGSEDSTMAFGKRRLIPHPLAKRLKVSNDFLRQTLVPGGGEALVRARLAYKFGVTQEKAFMTGDGVQKPLGIFTASADGIDASRDVSTGNTTTALSFDGLISAKYALKGQYWTKNLRWIFHRDALAMAAKIKDGEGQYIWRQSVTANEPDTLLTFGIAMSEYAPNTFTTGLYVGALGEWSYYWIADAYDFALKRLDELYAETNQVGFIGRQAVDGQAVLAEAFVRIKLA
jgi:HK97 family phage major capsid protein